MIGLRNRPAMNSANKLRLRALVYSILINIGIFLVYPVVNQLLHRPDAVAGPIPIEVAEVPPPPPPEPPRKKTIIEKQPPLISKLQRSLDFMDDSGLGEMDADLYLPELVYDIGEVDTLPKVVEFTKPRYPEVARKMGLEGRVTLKLLIDYRGRVVRAEVTAIRGFEGFGPAAVQAAKSWRFTPAEINREPVSVWAVQEIAFELD